jgi:ABC-type branched-subunit amino acid transport system permease subunit
VSSQDFTPQLSVYLLVGMAIGGATSVFGSMAGGLFLELTPIGNQDIGVAPVRMPLI